MVTGSQSEPWHTRRADIYPNIPKHKRCTDVHDYRMRINGAPSKLAAWGSLSLNHDLICLERLGWRDGWRDQHAGYRGGLEIGVGGHGYHVSVCKCVCLCMFVCILKRWNEALQQPGPFGGGKGSGSVVTQQYTQRPPKPPPQSNLCHFSTLPPTSLQFLFFFCRGLTLHKKTVALIMKFWLPEHWLLVLVSVWRIVGLSSSTTE